MIVKMTGKMIGTKISIPGNQMFIVFHTDGQIAKTQFFTMIVEGMYIPNLGRKFIEYFP